MLISLVHPPSSTGGYPTIPTNIPGAELGIDSDRFFDLETQPKRVAIVGTGYIGIEIAGIFNTLGSQVTVFSRSNEILRTFDPIIKDTLKKEMESQGVKIITNSQVTSLEREDEGKPLKVKFESNGVAAEQEFDLLMWAIGRSPKIETLNLEKVEVNVSKHGYIISDEYQNTTTEGIYALGDVCGVAQLTPGMCEGWFISQLLHLEWR
jgi:glutathione reductase (NADPH)